MVNKSYRKSKNGTLLFEPFVVYRIPRLARNKLQSVASLYRWVLLKNSITHEPQPHLPDPAPSPEAGVDPGYRHDEDDEAYEVVGHDYFSFPDPRALHDEGSPPSARNDENQWLDSLLEGLEDDDEDDIAGSHVSPNGDVAEPLSPLYSPMSSSDDLADQSNFYSHYVPYSPVSPPVIPSWFELHTPALSDSVSTSPSSAPYDSPLPYYAVDELEDSPVPDAIEDTSDDESDLPSTPSVTSTSSLARSPPSPASPSTPLPRTRFLSHPQVYVETDDSYFYPFELDPLPFPDDHHHHLSSDVVRPTYPQEC